MISTLVAIPSPYIRLSRDPAFQGIRVEFFHTHPIQWEPSYQPVLDRCKHLIMLSEGRKHKPSRVLCKQDAISPRHAEALIFTPDINIVLVYIPLLDDPTNKFTLRSIWFSFMMNDVTLFYACMVFALSLYNTKRKLPPDSPLSLNLRTTATTSINEASSDPKCVKAIKQ